MFQITNQETLDAVMTDAKYPIVVLDIYADWCMPCKLLTPKLEELSKSYPSALFCKLNVESGLKPTVTNLPTIEFWQIKGESRVLVHTVVGANLQEITSTLTSLIENRQTPIQSPPTGKPKSTGNVYKTFGSL